ncbi:hypothetical protein [Bdellovibrio bacteriovorus]|nr:hypothetical protein [Bdellovibrio bacteriovorus]
MNKSNFLLTMFAVMFLGGTAHAGLLFNYSQLALKDLDQMNQLVSEKVKESKKSSSGKAVPLKEALQAVYARPNDDEMIEKVVSPLRSNLDELESWEKTISQLTDEAINALKNPRAFKPVVQVTYVIFLENLLAEIKPHAKNDGFERKIAERIRDAKIEVTKDAVSERKLRMMKDTTSPSEIAGSILTHKNETPSEKPADSAASEQ